MHREHRTILRKVMVCFHRMYYMKLGPKRIYLLSVVNLDLCVCARKMTQSELVVFSLYSFIKSHSDKMACLVMKINFL